MNDEQRQSDKPTKYRSEFVTIGEQICADKGLTDEALADYLHISRRSLYKYKREHPEFAEAVQRGKDVFDSRVVESKLLERACGYYYDEETSELSATQLPDGNPGVAEMILVKIVRKHVIPDVGAISLWLKNRNPKRWREIQNIIIEDAEEELTVEQAKKILEEIEHAGNGIATE